MDINVYERLEWPRQLHHLPRHPCLWIVGLALFVLSVGPARAATPKPTPRGTFKDFDQKAAKRRLGAPGLGRYKKRFQRRRKTLIRLPQGRKKPSAGKKPKAKGPQIPRKGALGGGRSADEAAAAQAAILRRQRIKMMLALLRQLTPDSPSGKAQQVRLYHRLGAAYLGEATYLYFQAMKRHTRSLDRWVKVCDKQRARKQACPPRPKPSLAKSLAYRTQSTSVARLLLKKYPRYHRADEVAFTLLLTLQRLKRTKAARAIFARLRKAYPRSRYLADAYMVMADQAFHGNKVTNALRYYKQAMVLAKKRFQKATNPTLQVRMRGIHLRSMYMLAWCDFNTGDLDKSLRRFQRVHRLSRQYHSTRQSKILFLDEALRDMLKVYAKMGKSRPAYLYLRRAIGPTKAHKATRSLASRLSRMGNELGAIKALRLLQGIAPSGRRDALHPRVPLLQMGIVTNAQRVETPAKVYPRIVKLMEFLQEDSPWAKRWRRSEHWTSTREAIEGAMVTWATTYHKKAQVLAQKKNKRAEQFFSYATKLYSLYLLAYPKTESSNSLRFFLAELLYRKAEQLQGKRRKSKQARRVLAQAARHYHRVSTHTKRGGKRIGNPYRKQATFAELLCYERILGRQRFFRVGRIKRAHLRVKADGSVTWKRRKIRAGSIQAKLVSVYRRYLKIASNKEERFQTYYKLGVLYAAHRYYLRSTDIFSAMAREYPQHELSRRAAFMILYSYQDLRQWPKLERSARMFLQQKELTKKKAFRQEMHAMLMKAAYLPHLAKAKGLKAQNTPPPSALLRRFVKYAKEFGRGGPWVKRGFVPSPRAPNALAIAADGYVQRRSIFQAIQARRRLLRLYPKHTLSQPAMLALGSHYEQIAAYAQAAHWYERFSSAGAPDAASQAPEKRQRPTLRKGNKAAQVVALRAQEAKLRTQRGDALYRAAAFRRGLGQYARAIKLYRAFLVRFPTRKERHNLPLAIAQTYEAAKQWAQARVAYEGFLNTYQAPKLGHYLRKAAKLIGQELPKRGLISGPSLARRSKPLLLKRLGKLPRPMLLQPHLLLVHERLAALQKRKGDTRAWQERLRIIEALGFQMLLHRLPSIAVGTYSRSVLARARFHLVELQFARYAKLKFVGHRDKDRKVIRRFGALGKVLKRDYMQVMRLQSPAWVLAAIFRVGQINHLFARRLLDAPAPQTLVGKDLQRYKSYLGQMAMRYEEPALDAYDVVLRKSAAIGLYNRWVQLCEKARDQLARRKNRINPYTIFRRRVAAYWMVETKLPQPQPIVPPQPRRPIPRR